MAHSGDCQKCKDQLREIVTECILKCNGINAIDSISGELNSDAKEYFNESSNQRKDKTI